MRAVVETGRNRSGCATHDLCPDLVDLDLDATFDQRRRKDHEAFYCPSGHPQSYTGQSEADKLRKQLVEAQRRADMEANTRRAAEIEAKRAKTRLKKLTHRVNCGVCPHCQRTFKQLAEHMKTKHPEVNTART